jgi:hypothetical protein
MISDEYMNEIKCLMGMKKKKNSIYARYVSLNCIEPVIG